MKTGMKYVSWKDIVTFEEVFRGKYLRQCPRVTGVAG